MRAGAIAAAVILCGCMSYKTRQILTERAERPVICRGKIECDLAWQHVAVWIKEFCPLPIDQRTDVLVETRDSYDPTGQTASCSVRRSKLDGETELFSVTVDCWGWNAICLPNELEAQAALAIAFDDYFRAVRDGHAADP